MRPIKSLAGDSKEAGAGRAVAGLGLAGWDPVNGVADLQNELFFKRHLV